MPSPGDSCTSRASASTRPRPSASCTSASATTWAESSSTDAARRSSSSGSVAVERHDALDRRRPEGQRPGLVQQHRADAAELFDHARPLHDDADARGAREPRHERDRGREDERAGRGDDEHGQGAHGVAAERPRAAGEQHRDGQQEGCVAIGHAHEGRALVLGLLDEPHDRRVRALRRPARGLEVERLAGVRGAAAHGIPGRARDRQRLARQRRLVDRRRRRRHDAVDRHDLA